MFLWVCRLYFGMPLESEHGFQLHYYNELAKGASMGGIVHNNGVTPHILPENLHKCQSKYSFFLQRLGHECRLVVFGLGSLQRVPAAPNLTDTCGQIDCPHVARSDAGHISKGNNISYNSMNFIYSGQPCNQ